MKENTDKLTVALTLISSFTE